MNWLSRHRVRCIDDLSAGNGFTLVEIIVVMVVTGLMAMVAAAALNSIGGGRAAAAARLIQRDLTFARQRAIATGTRVWIPIDVGADSYRLLAENPDSPGRAGALAINDPGTGRAFLEQLNDGAFVDVQIVSASFDGAAEIGFDWLGRPLGTTETALTADGSVVLNHGYSIMVDAGSGHVTIAGP